VEPIVPIVVPEIVPTIPQNRVRNA
jgi:hypothetical protein